MNVCMYCTHWTEDENDPYKGKCDYLAQQVDVLVDIHVGGDKPLTTQVERPRFVTEADFGCTTGYNETEPKRGPFA